MASRLIRVLLLWTLSLGGVTVASEGPARTQSCDAPVATVVSVQGKVELREAGSESWSPAALNDPLCPGDTLRALRRSRAGVQLDGSSMLRIAAGTEMTFEGPKRDGTQVVDMLKGAAHMLSRSGDGRLDVNTPFAVAGVRGTEFVVTAGESEAGLHARAPS